MPGLISAPIGNQYLEEEGASGFGTGALEGHDPLELTKQVGRGLENAWATQGYTTSMEGAAAPKFGAPEHFVDKQDLKELYGGHGAGELNFPNDLPASVAQNMRKAKDDELLRRSMGSRVESPWLHGALDAASQMLDPLNLVAGAMPMIGEARLAGMLAREGSAAFEAAMGRTAVRVGAGAFTGAVSQVPLIGARYGLSQEEQADYKSSDALADLLMGTVLGGGLHAAFSGAGDLWSSRFRGSRTERLINNDPAAAERLNRAAGGAMLDGRPVEGLPQLGELGELATEEQEFQRTEATRQAFATQRGLQDKGPDVPPEVTPDVMPPPTPPPTGSGGAAEAPRQVIYGNGAAVTPISSSTIKDVLPTLDFSHIASDSISAKLLPQLRDKIVEAAGDMPVHLVSASDMRVLYPKEQAGALYHRTNKYIAVSESTLANEAFRTHALMHEAVHAVMDEHGWTKGGASTEAVEHVGAIMNAVDAHHGYTARSEYGFTNSGEFLAESLSNPRFQSLLAATPISSRVASRLGLGEGRRTAWDAVVSYVRQFFGLPEGDHNALEAILHVARKPFDEKLPPLPPTGLTKIIPMLMGRGEIKSYGDIAKMTQKELNRLRQVAVLAKQYPRGGTLQDFLETLQAEARNLPAPARRAPTGQVAAPETLFQLIRKNGYLAPHGDLTAMDLHQLKYQLVRKKGMTLDAGRELAEQHGFLPEGSTEADFLNLLNEESHGRRQYGKEQPGAQEDPREANRSEVQEGAFADARKEMQQHVHDSGEYLNDAELDHAAQLLTEGVDPDEAIELAIQASHDAATERHQRMQELSDEIKNSASAQQARTGVDPDDRRISDQAERAKAEHKPGDFPELPPEPDADELRAMEAYFKEADENGLLEQEDKNELRRIDEGIEKEKGIASAFKDAIGCMLGSGGPKVEPTTDGS